MSDEAQLLDEQIEYYRARASEYDDWFYRRDRSDRGEEHRKRWFAEAQEVRDALATAAPSGNVLELACGTGVWTRELLRSASRVVAVDASPEVVEINRRCVGEAPVEYVLADIFDWEPTSRFDFVFFGFWLSHVPPSRFEAFWRKVRACLLPGAPVFFVDSALHPEHRHREHRPPDRQAREGSWVARRDLKDGREFDIVKLFYEPEPLSTRLEALGWKGYVRQTERFFLYGQVR